MVLYKTWSDNGIMCLSDIFSMNGQILSYEEFRLKYNFQTNFLEFYGLINSVRQYINSFNFQETLGMTATPVQPLAISYILRNKKGCRGICKIFVENKMPHISFPKWGIDLNLDDNFNWQTVLSLPFNIEQDTNLKWFQFRIIHRILGTNYLLTKMRLKQNDKCTFCNIDKETIKHLFWECEHVQYFWDLLKTLLRDNCGFENISFNAVDIILGNPKFEGTLNKIVLWGKKFIYRSKIEEKLPAFNGFLRVVNKQYKIDKYIAKMTQNMKYFK